MRKTIYTYAGIRVIYCKKYPRVLNFTDYLRSRWCYVCFVTVLRLFLPADFILLRSQLVVFPVYYWHFLYLNVFSLPDFQPILFPLHFMHSSTRRVSSFPFWTKAIIVPVNPLKFENRAPLLFSLSQNHREVHFCSEIFHDQSHLYPVCMIYEFFLYWDYLAMIILIGQRS